MGLNQFTTGFYMAKLDEICYQVCFSSWRDVYETIQNPEFRNPAIGGTMMKTTPRNVVIVMAEAVRETPSFLGQY